MIVELEKLKKYDLEELEKYKGSLGDIATCLIKVIKTLAILENRTDGDNNDNEM